MCACVGVCVFLSMVDAFMLMVILEIGNLWYNVVFFKNNKLLDGNLQNSHERD